MQRCPYKDSDFSFREKKINIDQVYLFNHKSKKIIDKYFITKKFILGSFNNNNQKKNEIKKVILFSCHAFSDANHGVGNNFLF